MNPGRYYICCREFGDWFWWCLLFMMRATVQKVYFSKFYYIVWCIYAFFYHIKQKLAEYLIRIYQRYWISRSFSITIYSTANGKYRSKKKKENFKLTTSKSSFITYIIYIDRAQSSSIVHRRAQVTSNALGKSLSPAWKVSPFPKPLRRRYISRCIPLAYINRITANCAIITPGRTLPAIYYILA